jgi:hypothetical protein
MGAVMDAAASGMVPQVIDWGIAGRPLGGIGVSGDLHVVAPFITGVLVAVIDGLGHGPEAAAASRAAAAALTQSPGDTVDDLMASCHAALRRTRGAAISMASFDRIAGTMTWVGVGNVDGVVVRGDPGSQPQREALACRGGVVGYQMPRLRPSVLPVRAGDLLVFVTDGIKRHFDRELPLDRSPSAIAAEILVRHGRETDDALAVAVRYLGGTP